MCSVVSDLSEIYTASDDKECDYSNFIIHCNPLWDQDTDSYEEYIFFIVTLVEHACISVTSVDN